MEVQKITSSQELREYLKGINAAVKDVQITGTDEPGVAQVIIRLTLWHYIRYKQDYKTVIQDELNKRAPAGLSFKVVCNYHNWLYMLGRGLLLLYVTWGALASIAFMISGITARFFTEQWAAVFFKYFIEYFDTIHSLSFTVGMFSLVTTSILVLAVSKDLLRKIKKQKRTEIKTHGSK